METLLAPFGYEFMVKAMMVSGLIGVVCALLSCFVTLKGWSLMGDALSHAVVPGVAAAWLLGLPFSAGAFATGMLAAGGMGIIKARTALREDAVIGVVFTSFFALGLLMISMNPAHIDLRTIILGNILGIADEDAMQVVVIAAVVMGVILAKWRDLLLYCFDPRQAQALGLRVRWLHFLLLAMLSATVVSALQAVGAVLVVAMLVTPGAAAYLLTDRFGLMLWIAAAMGGITSAIGAYASYFFGGSTGGCIVTLQTLLFLAALVAAPRHGLLAQRRLRAQTGSTI
jgi:ABC-type Mn2+/Zn2+ transport system permease subunit